MTDKEYYDIYEKLRRIGYHADDHFASHLMPCVPWIIKNIPFNNVLDIGCSSGGALGALESFRPEIDIFGIDISFTAAKNGFSLDRNIVCGSAINLPYKDKTFDLVVSSDCLEHLAPEDIDRMIKEVARVTKEYIFIRVSSRKDTAAWGNIIGKQLHLTIQPLKWWYDKFFNAWPWPKMINIDDRRGTFCIMTHR